MMSDQPQGPMQPSYYPQQSPSPQQYPSQPYPPQQNVAYGPPIQPSPPSSRGKTMAKIGVILGMIGGVLCGIGALLIEAGLYEIQGSNQASYDLMRNLQRSGFIVIGIGVILLAIGGGLWKMYVENPSTAVKG